MQHGFYKDTIITIQSNPDYDCNAQGYHTHSIDSISADEYFVLGCSHTYGLCMSKGQRFSDQLEKLLDKKIYNFSKPGISGEECVRTLYSLSSLQSPQAVIIVWPNFIRRNYYDITDERPKSLVATERRDRSLLKHIINNTTDMNIAHFYNNMFFAEYWAKVNNTKVYHFIANQSDIDILVQQQLPTDNICPVAISDCLEDKDFALDGIHLGPNVHKKFAQIIFDWIKS